MAKRIPIEAPAPVMSKDFEAFYQRMKEGISIDRYALDDMWVDHPQYYHEIAERLALEISLRDEAKDDMANLYSDLDQQVRELHAEDEKKPTETALKNEINSDPAITKAKGKLRGFERSIGLLSGLRDTYSQRRYALQDITQLSLSGYFLNQSDGVRQARASTHESARAGMQAERLKKK